MKQKPPQSPSDPIRRDPASQKITSKSITKDGGKVLRKTVLDWKGYFIEFCKVHGEPVEHRTNLLFRDGWRYAMEYAGPEYPPPNDHSELDKLVVIYWTARHRLCTISFDKVYIEKQRVEKIRDLHSLPLRQVTIIGKGQERKQVYSELDTRGLDDRLRWLREDIEECEERLREIESYYKGNGELQNGTPT